MRGWYYNGLNQIGCDLTSSGQGLAVTSCEQGNEALGSTKG
jgi:hypothetical protein